MYQARPTFYRLLRRLFPAALLMALLCGTALAADGWGSWGYKPEIVWSHTMANGYVSEEIDADGNYYFHCPAGATVSGIVSYFMRVYGLNQQNFAFSYYCPDTGEEYAFNDLNFMHAASTYKLPLNMYYYDMESAGVYSGERTYVAGMSLNECHRLSIVWSDNYTSEAMIYYLGTFRDYKTLMNRYYGQLPGAELDDSYWTGNYYCTRFMMNTLKDLYNRNGHFWRLIYYMLEASPEEDLTLYNGYVPIAHKVGEYESHFNDVGIIFTPQPFLVAIYTDGISTPGDVIGRMGAALIDYHRMKQEELGRMAARAPLPRQVLK